MINLPEQIAVLGVPCKQLSPGPVPAVSRILPADQAGPGDCAVLPASRFCADHDVHSSGWACILIIADGNADEEQIAAAAALHGVPAFYLPDCTDPRQLATRITEAARGEHERLESLVQTGYRALVNLLARGAGVAELEAHAYKLLGNPMIITDESYKVLAHTKGKTVQDPVWESIVTNTYSTANLVEQTDVNNFWERLERAELPLFVDDAAFAGLIRRAVAKIRIGSETKGYIALLEAQRKITPLDLHVLQMVAEVLSVKINEKDTVLQATGQLRDEFSADLLTGNITSEQMAENRARSLGLHFGRHSCVLCVRFGDEVRYIGSELDGLRAALRPHCDLCIYTLAGSEGYYILSFRTADRQRALTAHRLEDMLRERRMVGILSLPVDNPVHLGRCYAQVQRLLPLLPRLLEPPCALYPYSRLAPLDLVNRMAAEDRDAFQGRAYAALHESDRREGTEYLSTLRGFFACNQSVSETAQRLFIHRNTVNYRLGRIRELLEDDFDDPLVRLQLQLSILANDLI